MATSTISKRSLRLNTHDLSTKVSYKTLRSRKIITVNERSLKTNTATRSKKLHMVAENIPLRKHESIKSNNNYSHDKLNKKKKVGKSIKKEQEKKETRSRKRNVVISSSINKSKHRVSIKERKVTNRPTEQRQMLLQESFKRQSLVKGLRPRRNKVNYCDDSKLLQQHLPSQHQDSVVMVERMCTDDNTKVPVYKTIKTSEQSSENTNDVYDFKYDSDDRREKLAKKKKKKKTIQVKSRVIKKRVHKKVTVETKLVNNDEASKSSDPNTNPPIEIVQRKSPLEPVVIPPPLPESTKEYALEIIEEPKVDTDIQTIEQIPPSDKQSAEQTKKPDVKKPRILSVENVTNITITKAPPGSAKDILPFRASSNIFNKRPMLQYRNLLNSSLLIKSLSPITKEHDTFDPGSPWRPPQLPYVFSQAKHFIQSTPNEIKKDTIHKKLLQIKGDSHNADKVANVSDIVLKNTNFLLQNLSDNKVGHKKNSNMYRKFGTEITNIEYLNNCTTIQDNKVEVVSEKPVTETEANSVTNVQLNKIAITSPNSSFDDTDDKENVATNYQTPKKSMKKKLKKRHFSNLSPFKAHEIKSIAPSENVDPQPGPSGIAASKKYNEQRILRQSNLNNFLNLMDMPENTRISTKHGIFNDAHSSPVSSSAIKKPSKPAMEELENAFGFCDNDAELSTSPTKDEPATDPASTKVQATCASKPAITPAPVRLSLRELRNNLLQKKPNKNAGGQQMKKHQIVEVSKPPEVEKNNRLVNVTNFSDTFDILSESETPSNCETNIPLFVDLEPSHFTMPPQHSYKRKRGVMFHFSDGSGNEEDEREIKTHAKKKKFTKLDKENKKRLDDWVKTVNNTFQEIDEYDLLIE